MAGAIGGPGEGGAPAAFLTREVKRWAWVAPARRSGTDNEHIHSAAAEKMLPRYLIGQPGADVFEGQQ